MGRPRREPRIGQLPLRPRLAHHYELAVELVTAINATLGRGRGLLVYPLVAVVGGPFEQALTSHNNDLVPLDLVPAWVSRLPTVHDALDVAALAEAAAQVCPPYRPGR